MGKYLADSYDAALRENADLKTRLAHAEACLAEKHLRLTEAERDAARYRWLRGGSGPQSVRWSRWSVQHWTGSFWATVQSIGMDVAIDAAMFAEQQISQSTADSAKAAAEPWDESKCTCVYATSANTASVRKGFEMGGYVKEQCDYCKAHASDQPPACANCGGSGIIRWQAYDGTEEGHEEQDPCPVCASSKSGASK